MDGQQIDIDEEGCIVDTKIEIFNKSFKKFNNTNGDFNSKRLPIIWINQVAVHANKS